MVRHNPRAILQGEIEPERISFAAYLPAHPDPGDALVQGRYLSQTTCSECHGPDLHGWPGDAAPGLAIVAAYTREEFLRLMATGESASGRELGMMKGVSLDRFSHYSEEEVAAMYQYLRSAEFYANKRPAE